MEDIVNDLARTRTIEEEGYCGEHNSLADYAQELTAESTTTPDNLADYIDYEWMAHDT